MNKNELENYLKVKRKVQLIKDELAELATLNMAIDPTKPKVTATPKTYDTVGNIIIRIDSERKKLENELENAIAEYTKITEAINQIDDLLYREILIRKYISGETYEEIAEKTGMSTRWIYKLMGRALNEIEKNSSL